MQHTWNVKIRAHANTHVENNLASGQFQCFFFISFDATLPQCHHFLPCLAMKTDQFIQQDTSSDHCVH